jgi:hypothetical protein
LRSDGGGGGGGSGQQREQHRPTATPQKKARSEAALNRNGQEQTEDGRKNGALCFDVGSLGKGENNKKSEA